MGYELFKAPFKIRADGQFHKVSIPFSDFSAWAGAEGWSRFTGDCSTKDPKVPGEAPGQPFVCCTESNTGDCPIPSSLVDIDSIYLSAEGVDGKFDLEISEIGAGFGSKH